MQELLDDLGRNLSCPATLGRILRRACDEGVLAAHLNSLLRKLLAADEGHLKSANTRSMVLGQTTDFILHLRRVGNSIAHLDRLAQLGRFVHTPGSKCVSLLLSAHPVTIQQFRLPPDLDRSVFVAGVPLVELESIVDDGEPIFEAPDDQIIREFECSEGDAWMLRLTYKPFAVESWIFDKDSLRSVFPAAVRPETSSLVSLCQVFGATQDADAAPFVLELARHEAHFVRWAAIQAMGRIDGNAARQLLAESCEDPHPHIQAAARKTLERIGA